MKNKPTKIQKEVMEIIEKWEMPVTMGWDEEENIKEMSKARKELLAQISKLQNSGDKKI